MVSRNVCSYGMERNFFWFCCRLFNSSLFLILLYKASPFFFFSWIAFQLFIHFKTPFLNIKFIDYLKLAASNFYKCYLFTISWKRFYFNFIIFLYEFNVTYQYHNANICIAHYPVFYLARITHCELRFLLILDVVWCDNQSSQ